MKFAQFEKLCAEAGLIAVNVSQYHWRVDGGERVTNYYMPSGKIYVNGSTSGAVRGTPEKAIKFAGKPKEPEFAATPVMEDVSDSTMTDGLGEPFHVVRGPSEDTFFIRGRKGEMFNAEGIKTELGIWLEGMKS